ncbi:MAG: ribonuclease HII, partial [Gammaproteobacteria bacterium]|nr:ribonuclease HII [Gammaproteobacteria bacterium]
EIDEINILQASFVAMRRALAGIRVECRLALVDGNKDPGLNMPTRCIVGGDATEPAISAASIIAKQHRDRFMDDLAVQYPHYGFEKHAGYPTKAHIEAIHQVGICPQHRRSFGPVKRYLEEHHV